MTGYFYKFKLYGSIAQSIRGYKNARKAIEKALAEADELQIWYEKIRVIGDLDKPTKEWLAKLQHERGEI